ncbi:MAG: VOC family protein [Sphingomonadales bacterium]|nr:VOC family protein [Sphingomonadales bacterium]
MIEQFHATKLVVADLDRATRFYTALGLREASRNLGGDGDVRQDQVWLSTGEASAHVLILSRFTELPLPPPVAYPGQAWLAFRVDDVEAVLAAATAYGGKVLRAGEDIPAHAVRAGLVSDPDGHVVELVGPMRSPPATS